MVNEQQELVRSGLTFRRGLRNILASCFLCLVCCGGSRAQGGATAEIHGFIRDTSGAAVADAAVRAVQTDTGVERSVATSVDGGYVLTSLPIGPYRVEVSKQGFANYVQTGITLAVGTPLTLDVTLQVGAVSQQIEVQGGAPLVETQSTNIGHLVEAERVLELPLNGRQVTDLIILTGGATSNSAATGVTRTIAGPPVISFAGGLAYSAGYLLDGADYYNYANAATFLMPFPDALQEFKVDTSGLSAQQGTFAQVSAATKSGGNVLHGDVFEFFRNGDLNARNYFATRRDDLKRNQFGGVIGGPIQKDKLFFFFGYQGSAIRSANPINVGFIPTAQMLAGDWTAFASPSCNRGQQLQLGGLFTANGNKINPALYNKPALNLINRMVATAPTPNSCGQVTYPIPIHNNDHQFLGRLDYQVGKQTIFGRYFTVVHKQLAASDLTTDLLASTTTGENDLMQQFVLGHTYVVSPNVVNTARFSLSKLRYGTLAGPYFSGCDLGINMYCGYYPTGFTVALGNAFTIGQNLKNGADVITQSYSGDEDLTFIRGTHHMDFGTSFGRDEMDQQDCFFCAGVLIGSNSTTGSYLSDFLTGNAAVFTQSAHWHNSMEIWHLNLYATDTWRLTSRLTLTYGVRWEPFLPETLTSGNIAGFDIARFGAGLHSQVYPSAPPGFTYPGDPGFPNGQKGMYNHWHQFAPHVGLAWDPTGSGKMSIRAAWGLSYDQIGAHIHDDQTQQAPFYNLSTTALLPGTVPGGGITNPWALLGGNPLPGKVGTVPPFTLLTAIPYDIQQPYTSTWNLTVQRQLSTNWLVSLSYIGSETTHIWGERPLNYAVIQTCPGGAPVISCNTIQNENQRRILNLQTPGLNAGSILLMNAGGTASYNGLLMSVEHRLSNNFSIQANYTWSHCISDFDPNPTMQAGEDDYMWTNPLDRRADRGACDEDVRHVFNLTGVARTPQFEGHTWGMVARDWQLSPIFRLQSGQPLNVVVNGFPGAPTGPDVALNGSYDPIKGSAFQRANCIAGINPYGPSGPGGQYLNPAAFSIPSPGTLGNCPYNGFRSPNFWQFDVALSRMFSFKERHRVELRVEAFNLLNKFRPGTCNVLTSGCQFLAGPYLGQMTFNSAFTLLNNTQTFGKVISAMDPRIMQLAVKYVF